MPTLLRGITWNHTRGYGPMAATAQRWHELHPEVEIIWERRTLQAFADESITSLAQRFDLLVVDHPSMGEAAAHGLFLPLEQHLPADFLSDQAANSTGAATKATAHWAMPRNTSTTPWGISAKNLIQKMVSAAQPRELLSG